METQTRILTQELYNQYLTAAKNYAKCWNVEDSHVIQIMTSVMLHRDEIRPGGGFVEAVVTNNLRLAVGRADNTCSKYLNVIVATMQNCYI